MNGKKVAGALLVGLVAMAVSPTFGTERTFTNNNASMSVPGSWDPAGVPGAGDAGIIGGGATPILASFTNNLSGPPTAIVVRVNGTLSLGANMTTEHNIVMEGGTITNSSNRTLGSTVSLRYDSVFLGPGTTNNFMIITGLIQNAGTEAGRLIVSNASATLAGYLAMKGASNTYSGGTVVHPGVLQITATDTLGTGPTELRPGSILEYGANISQRSRILGLGGKLRVSATWALTCTNAIKGDLEVETVGTTAGGLGGLIEDYSASETGRLVKTGTGQLQIKTGTNTYSGGTLIKEGILLLSAVERALGKGNVTVTNGAELRLGGSSATYVAEPTWPGWKVDVLSNATVRLSSSASVRSTNITVRDGGIIRANVLIGNYNSYDQVRIEGRVTLYRAPYYAASGGTWGGVFSDGAAPGHLVITGTGTGRVLIAAANLYTGGTEIEDGGPDVLSVQLTGSGRMPDVGEILIHANTVMDFTNISDTVGGLAGVGLVKLGKAVVTNLEGLSPGTNSVTTGTLTVNGTNAAARIVLGAASTNLFHIRAPGNSDQVVFQGLTGLTLAGAIKIAGAPGLASGTYTLFDLNGGSLLGTTPSLILPDYCTGSVATNSGDVVLTLKAPAPGTVIVVR